MMTMMSTGFFTRVAVELCVAQALSGSRAASLRPASNSIEPPSPDPVPVEFPPRPELIVLPVEVESVERPPPPAPTTRQRRCSRHRGPRRGTC